MQPQGTFGDLLLCCAHEWLVTLPELRLLSTGVLHVRLRREAAVHQQYISTDACSCQLVTVCVHAWSHLQHGLGALSIDIATDAAGQLTMSVTMRSKPSGERADAADVRRQT